MAFLSGCCCCQRVSDCRPLNCRGLAYDGSGSPCFHPRGPFWCCLPGPCSTCRDPWVRYYEERHADWIGRHVCNDCDTKEGLDGYVPLEPLAPPDIPARTISLESEADDE